MTTFRKLALLVSFTAFSLGAASSAWAVKVKNLDSEPRQVYVEQNNLSTTVTLQPNQYYLGSGPGIKLGMHDSGPVLNTKPKEEYAIYDNMLNIQRQPKQQGTN